MLRLLPIPPALPRCLLLSAAVLSLAACASRQQEGLGNAATTPLNDLNLLKTPIPEVLSQAKAQPYALPQPNDCASLNAEISRLDAALGADIDAPAGEKPDWLERGSDAAADAAVGAVQRTVEGVVPFRSWLRKLSGAERQSRRVREAAIAGGLRRAFLKGVRQQQACPAASETGPSDSAQAGKAASAS